MSKQNRNAEKKPLMYIVQADYSDTQSSMQDILIKKRKAPQPPEEEPMHGKREEECKTQPEGAVAVEPEKQVLEQHSRSEEAVQEVPAQAEQDTAKPEAAKKEPEAAEKEPEAVHNAAPEEKIPPKRVKKPMSRMSILEKIDFLTKLPHNMPRTLCLIEANGKTYRGVIVGRKNNAIFLRTTSNGAPAELAIDDITSLHPLGF
ncbi:MULTISPECIES: CotO family spore coat protein [Bacillus amyloliquefaciens group]|uniref:CotO family spore coat protein n=1 Tax=Bacillus amyloliquefaciens group TaxID=1938374 RepID=UPI00052A9103|nr:MULTISPECIES: CotO family spore coat protein [Bacillus amyloliquefaciens group]AIU76609.1 spore coat protein [Bacillus subtilis]AOO61046.1 spore coat protein [Bacillus velezensis]APH47100.1 spore coat protein [Bacillus amyloliquefaciens]KTF60602.1 spore coat protein [Bacillus amyloliquefaciens]NOL14040.1 spore coat protein [Bacillus velezensis]